MTNLLPTSNARVVFCLSLDTGASTRLHCAGNFPKPRIHHSAVIRDNKLVIYGMIVYSCAPVLATFLPFLFSSYPSVAPFF